MGGSGGSEDPPCKHQTYLPFAHAALPETKVALSYRNVRFCQSKTQKPVRFEITKGARQSLLRWMEEPLMVGSEFLWPGRFHERLHISTRQYVRLVRDWVKSIGLEPSAYGTHSMRRTKVAQIYRKTGNLRAVQLLLGHTKMDSTVRYLGVELEDAL
ncbi:tyrosine-type recombinase/integrase [Halocynthiibacter sp. C4]|uniref:tyrosine-type recombinase/integrase n=1 Tax=Halocynthiibacter sp. C4 TaxID=2992758 RepID=UPI00406CCBA8